MTQSFSPSKAQADLINRMRIASGKARQPGTIKVQASDDGETAEILIYDVIGFDIWTGEGVTAKQFAEQVKDLGNVSQINVRINSPGGDVFDGMAIYNILVRHPAKIIVDVDGIAASIASVIAMAGDEIRMPENSTMMIHDAWGIVIGNDQDMRDMADILSKLDGQIAGIYARRSKLSDEEARKFMDAETWFTGSEAVAAGLADELTEPVKAAAQFDLSQFRNAPKDGSRDVATVTVSVDANKVMDAAREAAVEAIKDSMTVQVDGRSEESADEDDASQVEAEAVAVRLRQIDLDKVLTGAS